MVDRTSISGKTDPDGIAKDAGEDDIAFFFAEQLAAQEKELFDHLDDESPQPPDDSFWRDWAAIFLAFLIPLFGGMAIDAAETQIDALQIGVEHEAIAEGALQFSRTHAFNLVTDLNNTTRNALQKAITNFIASPDRDIENLKNQLAPIFGAARAENIAITETSRAFEAGKRIYANQLAKIGVRTDFLWHTMRDERVCVICEPNEGRFKSEGWTVDGIPAHPRDRCWTTLEAITG